MRSRVLLLFQSLAWRLLFFFCFLHEIKSHGSDAYRVGEKKDKEREGEQVVGSLGKNKTKTQQNQP